MRGFQRLLTNPIQCSILILMVFSHQMTVGQGLVDESSRQSFHELIEKSESDLLATKHIDSARLNELEVWSNNFGNTADSIQFEWLIAQYKAVTGKKYEALEYLHALALNSEISPQMAFSIDIARRDLMYDLGYFSQAIQLHQHLNWQHSGKHHEQFAQNAFPAFVFLEVNEFDQAIRLFKESIDNMQLHNYPYWEMSYTNSLGVAFNKMGLLDSAWKYFEQAEILLNESVAQELDQNRLTQISGLFIGNKAQILAKRGDHLQAIPMLRQDIEASLSLPEDAEYKENAIRSMCYLSSSYLATDQPEKAFETLNEAEEIIGDVQSYELLESYYTSLAAYYQNIGELQKGYRTLDNLVSIRDSMKSMNIRERNDNILNSYNKRQETSFSKLQQERLNLLETKSERQENIALFLQIIFGILFLILTALSIILFRTSRARAETNDQKLEIESQKKMLENSLKEKETLLREVNHRVKNNLQIVSSLLFIQSKRIKDSGAKKHLEEGQRRVQAMSLIHQKLYQEDFIRQTDFKDFLNGLVRQIIASYALQGLSITPHIKVLESQIDLERAVPISLIIHEMITNSVKHAFKNKSEGNIYITIKPKESQCLLSYSDDGSGVDMESYAESSESIGMKLISLLTRQLQGTFSVVENKPLKIEVIFPNN